MILYVLSNCLSQSRVEWQSNYIVSSVYLRLFMLPRLEYRVIIFGLIKCKLPNHLQEHAITTWWSHMPLPEQTEDLTEHKQQDVCGFMNIPQGLSSTPWICHKGHFFPHPWSFPYLTASSFLKGWCYLRIHIQGSPNLTQTCQGEVLFSVSE